MSSNAFMPFPISPLTTEPTALSYFFLFLSFLKSAPVILLRGFAIAASFFCFGEYDLLPFGFGILAS
jgi:hypothetical protein